MAVNIVNVNGEDIVNLTDATATADKILSGYTAYGSTGAKLTGTVDTYDGETSFTPTPSTQVVPTSGKIVAENIIVNPIPSNWGLITWNGAVLTVS
jgi:hypothetical protein